MRIEQQQQCISELARRLRLLGWETAPTNDHDADLIGEHGGRRFVVHVKVAHDSRRTILEALLANAILRARAAAQPGRHDGIPLAAVIAPTWSATMRSGLFRFAEDYAPGVAVALLSGRGDLFIRGPGIDVAQASGRRRGGALPATQPVNLFSDLNRWMLKILLAQQLSPEELEAPRATITSTNELADAADVSRVAARRLLAGLRAANHLDDSGSRLRLVRVEELLHAWRADNLRPVIELRARWLLPRGETQLLDAMSRLHRQNVTACLGLFAACESLGYRHVSGVPPHILVEEISRPLLDAAQVVPAHPAEPADVILRQARWPASVFRASVHVPRADGTDFIRAADVVQCWLDVADHPVRGDEQAAVLWRRVIQPRLLGSEEP